MNTIAYTDNQLKAYLLNQLPEDEIEALEDALLLDAALADRLEIVEMILIDSYARDEMSDAEARAFRTEFLNIPGNLRKVEDARIFQRSLNAVREPIPRESPFRIPAFAAWARLIFAKPLPALAFATIIVLVAVLLGIFIDRRLRPPVNQIAKQEALPSPERPGPENRNPKNPEYPAPKATPTPRDLYTKRLPKQTTGSPQEVWLNVEGQGPKVLGPGMAHVTLRKNKQNVRLYFELIGDLAKRPALSVSIRDKREQPVVGPLTVAPSSEIYLGKARQAVYVDVPSVALKKGVAYRFEIADSNLHQDFTIKK